MDTTLSYTLTYIRRSLRILGFDPDFLRVGSTNSKKTNCDGSPAESSNESEYAILLFYIISLFI
jgi:hypothetical protein